MKNINVPHGWRLCQMSEVATLYNGRAYKLSEWEDEGIPVIRLQNLTGTGDKYYYSNLNLPDHQYVNNGELLFMWSATFGPKIWKGQKAIYHYHIWKVECRKTVLEQTFMLYTLEYMTEAMKSQTNGSTMLHFTKGGMEEQLMLVPPLLEQKKIASIISTADEKIELIEQKIVETKNLKISLMQKLFFEGVGIQDEDGNWQEHKKYENTLLGKIPSNWKLKKLGEIAHVNPKPHKLDCDNEKVSFVGMADTSEQAKLVSLTTKLYSEVKKGFTSFLENDVLVAKITPCFENGKGAIAKGLENGVGFGSTEFHVIRSKKGISSPSFIHHLTTSYPFRAKGEMNMTGTAGQKRVSKVFIEKYPIGCPPINEQQKIAEILSTVDEKFELLQKQKIESQQLKRGLMQKLLVGEWRVSLDDNKAE